MATRSWVTLAGSARGRGADLRTKEHEELTSPFYASQTTRPRADPAHSRESWASWEEHEPNKRVQARLMPNHVFLDAPRIRLNFGSRESTDPTICMLIVD
jgi:hypothetical protein